MRARLTLFTRTALVGLFAIGAARASFAQTAPLSSQPWPVAVDSGWVSNTDDGPVVVFSTTVNAAGAPWVRLSFDQIVLSGDPELGTGSMLRIISLDDGAVQLLNSISVAQWGKTSAYFNGDTVIIEIVAMPNTGPNRLVMSEITAGLPDAGGVGDSICGPIDDRILSEDPRNGRLMPIGCTGWLFNDCSHCFGTAGHCISNGQQNAVMQFNVPLSLPGGGIQNPGPEDQYPVDFASIQSNGGQGIGNDWAYFGCSPNSNTGLTPFEAQGDQYNLIAPPPVQGQDIRITGYGTVSSPVPPTWNQVQKTHTGPYFDFSGSRLQYQVDTTGGNSGSPVIFEPTGEVIGVHTHAGCNPPIAGNNGTGSNHAGWQAALDTPQGICQCIGLSFIYPNGRPEALNPDGGTTVDVIVQPAGENTPQPDTGQLHYDDGNGFVMIPMRQIVTNQYEATFPAFPCGANVRYYFSAEATNGERYTDPSNAPTEAFFVLSATELRHLYSFNFETAPGWEAVNRGATSGDFERGVPVDDPNWAYDPISDSDGSGQAWLTQNQLGNTDVDNGAVRLKSPLFDLSAGSINIQYDYYLYLTNTDNAVDRMKVEIRDTTGPPGWTEIALHTTNGALSWRTHHISQADLDAAGVVLSEAMRFQFTVNDRDPQSIVEAGLDAFKIDSAGCGKECDPCDMNCDGVVDAIDIEFFIDILFNGATPCRTCTGDTNGDGMVDAGDIEGFINCLFP